MSALTAEEHHARAMLMGRVYDWRDHTYGVPTDLGGISGADMLDADTLERVPIEESNARLKLKYGQGGYIIPNWYPIGPSEQKEPGH